MFLPFLKKFRVSSFEFRVWQFDKAFTLIELLVVISIIAILVAAATTSWTNAQQKSRDGKRKSDLKTIQQSLELYFQNYGRYPDAGPRNEIKCHKGSEGIIAWGSNFTCEQITYINPLPKDPVGSGDHVYFYEAVIDPGSPLPLKYRLSANLENEKDQDFCPSNDPNCVDKLGCQPPANKNYCVVNP